MSAHSIGELPDRFELNGRTLCTRQMDGETKDEPFIKHEIKNHLKSFDLYALRNDFVYISDRGTNMVSALKKIEHLHCFAHIINNVVQHVLGLIEAELAPVKALVKYFKVTELNSCINETLKSYVKIRWNSVYYMGKSLLRNWDQINEVLASKGELLISSRIDGINIETLQVYLNL